MPLPAAVAKLDDIAEAHRPLYKQEGERFVLDVSGAEETFASGLKRNRDETMDKLKELQRKFDGVDPDKYRTLAEQATKAEEEKARAAGNWDSLRAQLVEQHTKATEKLTGEQSADRQFIRTLLADNAATKALGEAEGNVALLLPHVLKQIDVRRTDDGSYSAVVVDAKGNPRIDGPKGEPMSIGALVAEFKANESYGAAFKGSGAAGSGASGSKPPSSGAGAVRSRKDLKSDAEKTAYIGTHGLKAFTDLPAE